MSFGRGDAILAYPELIEGYGDNVRAHEALERADNMGPYVAVHVHASSPRKQPPHPEILTGGLLRARVPFVMVGSEAPDLPPLFRLHVDVVKRAAKFIGTLSVFNVVAQIEQIPSVVLVNRAIKEPRIYALMSQNEARVEDWNVGKPIEKIYEEAVEWASDLVGPDLRCACRKRTCTYDPDFGCG